VRYGFVLPGGDARLAAEMAQRAEATGWDAFFVYEPVWGVDAWISLAAAAMRTERIKLGTMLTPLPRRRPWDLAAQTATLDHLSGGRLILSVGLGALHPGWTAFEPDEGRRVRAEKLDEGLEVLTGLWAGQPFAYQGKHYQVEAVAPGAPPGPPPPVQKPRIKTWVVGAWPREQSMRRAARYDGWLPNYLPPGGLATLTPAVLREAVEWLERERGEQAPPYDVVVEGNTFRQDPASACRTVGGWGDAGATWWIEANWLVEGPVEAYVAERLEAGPPTLGY
jgi:alkanesulfonate monooxygenase SsuD/methylene tetrahydromethanopterin reductase-like flavin-dependent oxidoreductase (luciferase family)